VKVYEIVNLFGVDVDVNRDVLIAKAGSSPGAARPVQARAALRRP
jgi:hypothetical protein